jgi:hypothetical protein
MDFHATKAGPGRMHKNGTYRNGKRHRVGGVGGYGKGLAASFARKQRDRMEAAKQHPLRNEDGAFTVTGRDAETSTGRRIWLAGISAQRGY